MTRFYLEKAFDHGRRGAAFYQVGRNPLARKRSEAVNDDRLSGARLSRKQIEPGPELDFDRLDQRHVFDLKKREHFRNLLFQRYYAFAFQPFSEGKDRVRLGLLFQVGDRPIYFPVLFIKQKIARIAGLDRLNPAYDVKARRVILGQPDNRTESAKPADRRRGRKLGASALERQADIRRAYFSGLSIGQISISENNVQQTSR